MPTPNQSSASPNIAANNGNILLTDSSFTGTSGFTCPAKGTVGVIDIVGFGGGTNNCSESATAPTASNANSVARIMTGVDTNNNSVDFNSVAPTPQASGPSAASGTVSGRVMDAKENGLKFVTVMITGGGLDEPLYATTNQFGKYRFEDIPVGSDYVLQVFSRRHTFEQPSRIVSLKDFIEGADFIGREER